MWVSAKAWLENSSKKNKKYLFSFYYLIFYDPHFPKRYCEYV